MTAPLPGAPLTPRALARPHDGRGARLEQLRRQMATITGGVETVRRVPEHTGHSGCPERSRDSGNLALAARPVETLPVPGTLAGLLPDGLPRGTVATLSGARSPILGTVAAVTGAGGHAALVGLPDIGLLAAAEQGADLSRLAVIPDPGADPVEVAAVLLDGMDLVVLGLGGRRVAPARGRVVAARVRHRGCVLLISGGGWPDADLRLDARVDGYETTCGTAVPGFGRVGAVRLDVRMSGRRSRPGATRLRAGWPGSAAIS